MAIPDHKLPKHIAIIMDGNGRWAKSRGLPRSLGHKQGAKVVGEIAKYCRKIGVRHLTLYAFSTENWSRPKDEVDGIMNLLRNYLSEADQYRGEDVRSVFLGDRAGIAPDIVERMNWLEEESRENKSLTLNIAVNYGGRAEISRAVRRLAGKVKSGELSPEEIDEAMISQNLDTAGQPDPDLIIRPSGEMRLSNFLLWQCAYAEFVYMNVLWPDFTPADLDAALEEYAGRSRRFGGI